VRLEEDDGTPASARVCCRLEWLRVGSRAEGLPKSGALLQGAENGGAYACAKGMEMVKKITTARREPPFPSASVSPVYDYILRSIAAARRVLISYPHPQSTNGLLYSTPSLL
jgi:hypothetical protein